MQSVPTGTALALPGHATTAPSQYARAGCGCGPTSVARARPQRAGDRDGDAVLHEQGQGAPSLASSGRETTRSTWAEARKTSAIERTPMGQSAIERGRGDDEERR